MQRILDFLKRHYEKIVLSVVIAALAAAAYMGPKLLELEQQKLPKIPDEPGKAAGIQPVNLGPLEGLMQAMTNPPALTLNGDHHVFNPVVWKMNPDGTLTKFLKTGADALIVTKIYFQYERIGLDHASPPGFHFYYQVQSGPRKAEFLTVGQKSKSGLFILRGIKGAPDNPSQLQLELPATGERVFITKEQPYEQVDGHTADLKYPPEANLQLQKKKPGDTFNLDNVPYQVVSIADDSVTVQYQITTKQTTVPWTNSPEAETTSTAK